MIRPDRLEVIDWAATSPSVTVLGRLRRYARLLTGSQEAGDRLIRMSMTKSFEPRLSEPGTNAAFLAAVRDLDMFRVDDVDFEADRLGFNSSIEARALGELGGLQAENRVIFALVEVERLSVERVAAALDLEPEEIVLFVDVNEAAISRPKFERRILAYSEAEHGDALFDNVLGASGYNHDFVDRFDLIGRSLSNKPYDLLIYDSNSFESESARASKIALLNGVEYMDLASYQEIVMMGTASEHAALNEDALNQGLLHKLFVEPHRWVPPDVTFPQLDLWVDAALSDEEALAPHSAPIDAEVIDGQLRVAPSDAPNAIVPFSALDALRRQHHQEAVGLADELRSGNGSPLIPRKLDALAALLGQPLTGDMVVGLAVAIDGYARLLPTIRDEVLDLQAADLASFVYDIQAFTNQFPICRQFRAEAEAYRPISPNEEAALQSIVSVLIDQPDEVVDPALKERFEVLQSARAVQAGSSIGDVAWLRSVANSLKAVARQVKSFGTSVLSDARGKAVKGIGSLIVAIPVALGLKVLSISYPVEFAALTLLLTQSREQITKITGKGDEGEDED